jgi:outer membrane protein assembly factor BamD (BamD/ComL family)
MKRSSVNKSLTIHIDVMQVSNPSDSLYDQAILLSSNGEFKSAIMQLKKIISQDGEDRLSATNLLVDIYEKLDVIDWEYTDSRKGRCVYKKTH